MYTISYNVIGSKVSKRASLKRLIVRLCFLYWIDFIPLPTSKSKMHGISELKEKLRGVHCASPYNLVHFIFIQMNFLSQWFASVSTRCSHCYTLQKSHDNIILIHGIIVSWNITDLYIYLIQFDSMWIIIVRLIALVLYTSEHNLIIIRKKKKGIMWIFNMQSLYYKRFIHLEIWDEIDSELKQKISIEWVYQPKFFKLNE